MPERLAPAIKLERRDARLPRTARLSRADFEMRVWPRMQDWAVGRAGSAGRDRSPPGPLSFVLRERMLLLLGWLPGGAVAHDPKSPRSDCEQESGD